MSDLGDLHYGIRRQDCNIQLPATSYASSKLPPTLRRQCPRPSHTRNVVERYSKKPNAFEKQHKSRGGEIRN